MIANPLRVLGITLLMSLAGCGIRGPLYLPNVPPVPSPPSEPEPKGVLYSPQSINSPNTNSLAK
ncbi:MAG: lipoprotein [Polynucleobacter sp.]|nr:lipoprotein [Polynucleobacter sp.]MDZ4058279.1 lipoprotein [Polynucleobacter sp.]